MHFGRHDENPQWIHENGKAIFPHHLNESAFAQTCNFCCLAKREFFAIQILPRELPVHRTLKLRKTKATERIWFAYFLCLITKIA